MTGSRFRIVLMQDGKERVSTQPIGEGEIEWQLEIEATLHEGTGWDVERVKDEAGLLRCVYASKDGVHRAISARRYGPMEDVAV